MTETTLPLTKEAFSERLDAWEASLSSSFQTISNKIQLAKKLLKVQEKDATGMQVAAAAAAANDDAVSRVFPQDVVALEVLERRAKEFRKWVQGGVDEIIGRYYKMDLAPLFEMGIGEVIRVFRPVSASVIQREMCSFASGQSDGDALRLCLNVGADLDGLVFGQTALMKAVVIDSLELVQILAREGADLEVKTAWPPSASITAYGGGLNSWVSYGNTVIMSACRLRRWPIVRFLVAEGAQVGATEGGKSVLHLACESAEGQLDSDMGTEPFDPLRLHYKPEEGNPETRSAVCETFRDLFVKSSDEVVKSPVAFRTSGYIRDETFIHFFAWHGFEDLVDLAVSRGVVDIDALEISGLTALQNAAARGKPQMVKFLLERGADVHRLSRDGETAFSLAIPSAPTTTNTEPWFISAVREVLEILLEHGAEVNAEGRDGSTALHRAVQWGNCGIVSFLQEKGASGTRVDTQGETPVTVAIKRAFREKSEGARDVLKTLFRKPAIRNILSISENSGDTFLHLGVRLGDAFLVRFFLSKGVRESVNIRNRRGETPMEEAERCLIENPHNNERQEILQLLVPNFPGRAATTPLLPQPPHQLDPLSSLPTLVHTFTHPPPPSHPPTQQNPFFRPPPPFSNQLSPHPTTLPLSHLRGPFQPQGYQSQLFGSAPLPGPPPAFALYRQVEFHPHPEPAHRGWGQGHWGQRGEVRQDGFALLPTPSVGSNQVPAVSFRPASTPLTTTVCANWRSEEEVPRKEPGSNLPRQQ